MTNRQQRRAAQRRADPVLAGYRFGVTPDEAVILEEALAWWIHQANEDLPDERLPEQEWSLARAERLRQAFEAAIADRPWHDIAPERVAPGGD